MAKVLTDDKHYTDIASAIRTKNGTETTYKPDEMADAILALEIGSGGGSGNGSGDGSENGGNSGSDTGVVEGVVTDVKVYAVAFNSVGDYYVTFEDGTVASGTVTFDANGLPIALSDDQGNSVTFFGSYPISATDIEGHTVTISGC